MLSSSCGSLRTLVAGLHSSVLATPGAGDMLGVVKASSPCIVELTDSELGELPTSCVACPTATSSIAWKNLLGSGISEICSNAETSSSHWLCNRGPILPSFLYCCHRNLSLMMLHHISANPSTGPNLSLRVDRVISSNLMVTNSNQRVQINSLNFLFEYHTQKTGSMVIYQKYSEQIAILIRLAPT